MNLKKQETYPVSYFLTPEKQYDQAKLCYCAGYFDGEGCIAVALTKSRFGTQEVRLFLRVATYDLYSVSLFGELFGGSVREIPTSASCSPNVRLFLWVVTSSYVFEPLRAMLPHLRAKNREAETVLLSGWKTYQGGRQPGVRSLKMDEAQREERISVYHAIKGLRSAGRQSDYPLIFNRD